MRTSTLLMANILLASAAVYGADLKSGSTIDAAAAFARLKTLAGEWQANTPAGQARVSYEVIAGGSSVVEREMEGNMPPMLTVYYLDGNRLLLTHYCMAGNQPRMEARSFDAKTGEVRFEFLDVTNLASKDAGHMHNATIRVVDEDHLTAAWDFYEGGQKKTTERFELTRVR